MDNNQPEITLTKQTQCCVKCGISRGQMQQPPTVYSFDAEPWPIICQPCYSAGIEQEIKDFQDSEQNTSFQIWPICPHCGHKHVDAWEWQCDSGITNCEHCNNVFHYDRIVTVEYTTTKKQQPSLQ